MTELQNIDFLEGFSDEERMEARGELLALHFLSLVDQRMKVLNISKKELAVQVGSSPSYITQLFRGDKTPNWKMLAKMEKAVGVKFVINTDHPANKSQEQAHSNKVHSVVPSTKKMVTLSSSKRQQPLMVVNEPSDQLRLLSVHQSKQATSEANELDTQKKRK